jgi:hypothetical protein|tara:strand:- start:69 stop:1193 length:1125 start_codon:yes stop_codon:yes gene_type:complete
MKVTTLDSIIYKISSNPELVFPFRSNDNETYKESLERRLKKIQKILKEEFEKSHDDGVLLSKINDLCKSLVSIIDRYLEGHSGVAYKEIEEIFSEDGVVKNQLRHFISDLDFYNGTNGSLYRVRLSESELTEKKDMFHIPYNMRHLVKNQRYSIAGLPCLYLGSSILVCWEEMDRPDFSKMNISRFNVNTGTSFLNLAYAFRSVNGTLNDQVDNSPYDKKLAKLIFYPILMACSFKKKHKNAHFVEEYIIPSLLLQWVGSEKSGIDGIAYLSNKTYQGYEHKYGINYVFPPRDFTSDDVSFCNHLKGKLFLSKPVSWQILDSYLLNQDNEPHYAYNGVISDSEKSYFTNYKMTKFYNCEKKLALRTVSFVDSSD